MGREHVRVIVKAKKSILSDSQLANSASTLVMEKIAKRKKDDDYRAFQAAWTEEFAFEERAGSAVL